MYKKEYQVHVKQSKRYFYSITALKSFVRRRWILCLLFTSHYIEIPSLLQSFEAGGVLDACLLRRLRLPGFNGLVTFMLHNMWSVISSHSSLLCNRDSSYQTWKDHSHFPTPYGEGWHLRGRYSHNSTLPGYITKRALMPVHHKKCVILRTHFVSTVSAHLVTTIDLIIINLDRTLYLVQVRHLIVGFPSDVTTSNCTWL